MDAIDSERMISSKGFYDTYYGHNVDELEVLDGHLRSTGRSIIYLAGDSSADNKFWFSQKGKAINGYESILKPPSSKRDVAYCMNAELIRLNMGSRYAAVNCAVEESKVSSRDGGFLLPQDQFIRDHIRTDDILVVSVGGNDIALAISPCTISSMLALIGCSTTECLIRSHCGSDIPFVCDPFCCGGSCIGCVSNSCACPLGLGYFIHLFKTRIRNYLSHVLEKQKPKVVAVCMIYYPCETPNGSWADRTLGILGYDRDPAQLQALIRIVFELATSEIKIPGVRIVPIPLFKVLDGKDVTDYEQRVEPSAKGGEKMASFILESVLDEKEKYYNISSVEETRAEGVMMRN